MDGQLAVCADTDDGRLGEGLAASLALPEAVRVAGMALTAAAAIIDAQAGAATREWPPQLLRASRKRKIEYWAGRACAARALRAAGCGDAFPPGMGEDRLPLWPAGWLGSISHGGGQAVAAALRRRSGRELLGIDVEKLIDPASIEGIGALVALEGELALFGNLAPSQALTLLFSAKESLYKALHPAAQRFMDFSAARLTAVAPSALTLALTEDWHADWRTGAAFTVHYALSGERVHTVVYRP